MGFGTLRIILIAALFLNAAMATVFLELASVRLRYECVRMQEHHRRLALESRRRMRKLAEAQRTENLLRRAESFGIRVRQARHIDMERPRRSGDVARAVGR